MRLERYVRTGTYKNIFVHTVLRYYGYSLMIVPGGTVPVPGTVHIEPQKKGLLGYYVRYVPYRTGNHYFFKKFRKA